MQQPTPSNSANAPLQPVHVHIVDEFNLDSSLDIAASLLASRALASCDQVRVSSSGIHSSLADHAQLASVKSASSLFEYGKTQFTDPELCTALAWPEPIRQRNAILGDAPHNFLAVERQCRKSLQEFIEAAALVVDDDTGGAGGGSRDGSDGAAATILELPPFDLVLCSSREVYNAVIQYYEHVLGERKEPSFAPHIFFVVCLDPRFYRQSAPASALVSSSSSGGRSGGAGAGKDAKNRSTTGDDSATATSVGGDTTATATATTTTKPTLGQLFASLTVEVLGLMHVRQSVRGALDGTAEGDLPQVVAAQWKERFASAVKQYEQLRRVEVVFHPFVL